VRRLLAESDTFVTVRKGEAWGTLGPAPAGLTIVGTDRELFEIVNAARRAGTPLPAVGLRGGDLWRAVGGASDPDRFDRDVAILPVDLLRVETDDRSCWAAAHVVATRWGGWRGGAVAVMNGQYVGRFDVAPRAHPGDGVADIVEAAPAMTARERWQARRRLPLGAHVPHPRISTRRAATVELELPERPTIAVDGQRVGRSSRLVVTVEPDALTVYA